MDDKIICKKVSSMLSIYIDNKVSYPQRAFIEEHLANCEHCYKKYTYLKSLIKNLKDSYKQILELSIKKQKQENFSIREREQFLENLSPYVDNELDAQSCYEFRKYLLKSKNAQNELKRLYLIQKEMRTAFAQIKKKTTFGISYRVMNSLKSSSGKNNILFHQFINSRIAKVTVLAGLVLFGVYEAVQVGYDLQSNLKQDVGAVHEYVTEETEIPKSEKDFIEF